MSDTPQPIQFLLHQLATNEGDRTRFNQISIDFKFILDIEKFAGIQTKNHYFITDFGENIAVYANIKELPDLLKICFIRTCLSRINGSDSDAVLSVFKSYYTQLNCYLAFDFELRNGKTLDTAISALHEKMLELVSEYREFLK